MNDECDRIAVIKDVGEEKMASASDRHVGGKRRREGGGNRRIGAALDCGYGTSSGGPARGLNTMYSKIERTVKKNSFGAKNNIFLFPPDTSVFLCFM